MFTGIIEGLGTITAVRSTGTGKRLAIDTGYDLTGTRVGDSIAVNGACLTAVALSGRRFQADLSPETVARTTFSRVHVGQRVNLERALRLGDRLDGHLVSGHIDGLAEVARKDAAANAVVIAFKTGAALARYMIAKGSVAIDGISLTVNRCDEAGFEVSIIPHTARMTTVGELRIGDAVNIETDMLGKYVEKFVGGRGTAPDSADSGSPIDRSFLARNGFL